MIDSAQIQPLALLRSGSGGTGGWEEVVAVGGPSMIRVSALREAFVTALAAAMTLSAPSVLAQGPGDARTGYWWNQAPPKPLEEDADPDALAWRQGRLVVSGRPLAEVVGTLARYRTGRVLLLDRAAAARPVSGVFDLTDVDHALDLLADSLALRVTRLPGLVVLR